MAFHKSEQSKKELVNKYISATVEEKEMLEVKFSMNVNGIIREIADHGNVDSAAMGDCRCASQRSIVDANLSINEENGHDKKVEDVPEEVMLAKIFTFRNSRR